MNKVVVTNQKEWDELPLGFDEFTVIEVRSKTMLKIKSNSHNSSAELLDNSSVVLWDNSSAVLRDSSRAVLWDNSSAVLRDSSSAVLRDNSSADLRDNSRAVLWDNSSADLWDNSSAELWDNSSADLWDNSSAVLRDSSRAVLWDNSSALAFMFCCIYIYSRSVKIKHLADKATAKFYIDIEDIKSVIEKQDETAQAVTKFDTISFKTWLERGYVVADGIHKKLVSSKKIGRVEVFTCEEFLDKKESFVAKRGNLFSHGKTIEKAIEDLRYKIGDRDTSKYEGWNLKNKYSTDEIIQAYRTITGACEFGVKDFCKGKKLKNSYPLKEVFLLTSSSYGADQFKEFFEKARKK